MRYLASAAAQSGCSRRSLWPLKWKSPISGTPTPARSRRSRIGATAAAASLVLTVRRTSSDPARASACTCRTVPSMSAVSVLVIDCTTIGAPPPTRTGPTKTRAEARRAMFPELLMLRGFYRCRAWAAPTGTGIMAGPESVCSEGPRFGSTHRRGAAPTAPYLSGHRTEGRHARCHTAGASAALCCFWPEASCGTTDRVIQAAPGARRPHGRLRRLGHAGAVQLADRRAPRRAPRRGRVRRLAHVHRRLEGREGAGPPRAAARQRRDEAQNARQGALQLHAERARRRHRRPHRVLPRGELVPRGGECLDARQGPALDPTPRGATRRRSGRAHRSRHARDPGPGGARQGGAAARGAGCRRGARARRLHRARARRLVRGADRVHGRGRVRDDDAGGGCGARVAQAQFPRGRLLWPRRPRYAAARGRHEPLRQRHGRDDAPLRVGPRLDGGVRAARARRGYGRGWHHRSRPARSRGPGLRRGARGGTRREGGRALRGGRVREGGVRRLRAARGRGHRRQRPARRRAAGGQLRPLRRGVADAAEARGGGARGRGTPHGRAVPAGAGSGGRLMAFIPHTQADVAAMVDAIGVARIEDLFDEIPQGLRIKSLAGVPTALNEMEIGRLMSERARADGAPLSFIGAGAYEHHIPAAVWGITTRGEFYSAYTPYQAEASQGTLQMIYEFQTMIARLTGMEVANASMYDGASATAEAALMAVRANRKSKAARILVPATVHPHYRRVAVTTASNPGLKFGGVPLPIPGGIAPTPAPPRARGQAPTSPLGDPPNFFGRLEDVDALTDWARARAIFVIAIVNPTSLALLKPPGEWGARGADIAVGEGQPLGVPLSSGGPYLGFMTARMEHVRQLPGRIVGRTLDVAGREGFTLTLQAREQHIRRAKATSNICTNQGLAVTAATIYMSLMGPQGLTRTAAAAHARTRELIAALTRVPGVRLAFPGPYFHEAVLTLDRPAAPVLKGLSDCGILGGLDLSGYFPELGNALLVCATETKTLADVERYRAQLSEAMQAARAA